jgi:glycosyltransferase involved in cell wall biosynthesis
MVTGVYFPEVNGAIRQCMEITELLQDKVFFNVLTTTKKVQLLKYKHVAGIRVYRFLVSGHILSDILQVLSIFLFFIKHSSKFNAVHLHGFSSRSALIIILSKVFRKKVILKLTSFGHDDLDSVKRKGWLLYYCYSLVDAYIGISPIFEKSFLKIKRDSKRYHRIPNGVDTNLFTPVKGNKEKILLRSKLGLPADINLILFVGHFSLEKSAIHLLSAWLRLQEKHSTSQSGIVFIGSMDKNNFEVETEVVNTIRSQSKQFINNKVFFLEKTDRIEEYYQAADIYVLPSMREGLPNTLLEAMSCAVPVISTRLIGITDWIIDNNVDGFLYEPGDIDGLYLLLEKLLSDVPLRNNIGFNARKTIQSRFDISITAMQIYKLYKGLLS